MPEDRDQRPFVGDPVGDRTALGPVVEFDGSPLQRLGGDRLVYRLVVGGPATGCDQRLFLTRAQLERLLDVARASITGRVQLDMVGLKVELWEHRSGHAYAVWTLLSLPAKAEEPPILRAMVGPGSGAP